MSACVYIVKGILDGLFLYQLMWYGIRKIMDKPFVSWNQNNLSQTSWQHTNIFQMLTHEVINIYPELFNILQSTMSGNPLWLLCQLDTLYRPHPNKGIRL